MTTVQLVLFILFNLCVANISKTIYFTFNDRNYEEILRNIFLVNHRWNYIFTKGFSSICEASTPPSEITFSLTILRTAKCRPQLNPAFIPPLTSIKSPLFHLKLHLTTSRISKKHAKKKHIS